MKNKSSLTFFGITLVLLLVAQPAFVNANALPDVVENKGKKIQGQYIVVLTDDADLQLEIGKAKLKGADVLDFYEHSIKGFAVKVANDKAVDNIKKNNPFVAYIEPDYVVETFVQTLPPGINRIDVDLSSTASGNGAGSVSVDIAIIDTGINLTHPDLNVYKQKTFVKRTTSANDDNGHGTHVAGIAAAKDDSNGVVGVAPGARLWAVKVLDKHGSGSISNVIKGIDYVTANKAEIDVANMSLGCECFSSSLNLAISNSVAAGVTYVVAAGNSARDAQTFSPANHPSVIAVSAIVDTDGKCGGLGLPTSYGSDDTFASFSNRGAVVDMAAPGVKIFSTYKSGTYATLSGTSMASPHVAGAAGLYKASNPGASPAQVQGALTTLGVLQTTVCDTTLNNGNGGFTGDPDAFHEPLVYTALL